MSDFPVIVSSAWRRDNTKALTVTIREASEVTPALKGGASDHIPAVSYVPDFRRNYPPRGGIL